MMLGFCGSTASGAESPKSNPDFNARQLVPPSVLLNTPSRRRSPLEASLVAAYSVLGFSGSMVSEVITPEFSGKGVVGPQPAPPSVVLNRPAGVTAYTVLGFFGS